MEPLAQNVPPIATPPNVPVTPKKGNKAVAVIIVLLLIVGIAGAAYFLKRGEYDDLMVADQPPAPSPVATEPPPAPSPTPAQTPSSPPEPAVIPSRSSYKDGTYTADGNYNAPSGPEFVTVTLTLKNDIVVSADVVPHAQRRTAQMFQNMFISGYKEFVIGKNISDLHLTNVSGSSLTPNGFNDALAKIKQQAV